MYLVFLNVFLNLDDMIIFYILEEVWIYIEASICLYFYWFEREIHGIYQIGRFQQDFNHSISETLDNNREWFL